LEDLLGVGSKGDAAALPRGSLPVRFATRILVRTLDIVVPAHETLTVAAGGEWFILPAGKPIAVDRGLLRSLMLKLAASRAGDGPALVSRAELIATLWPDESVPPRAASNRSSVAISTLRSLGLAKLIVSTGEGVGLAPAVNVVLADPNDPRAANNSA
jgi:hypothetical protein